MKLSDIRPLTEGAVKDLHQDLLDAIADEFKLDDSDPMIQKIAAYLIDDAEDEAVDDFLQDHFEEAQRASDPKNWIANKMERLFSKETSAIWRAKHDR